MYNIVAISVGASLGALLRYFVSLLVQTPWGTLLVNSLGGFLIGLTLAYMPFRTDVLYRLTVTGFLGGLTTFSSFNAESILLIKQGSIHQALIYIILNVVVSLSLTILGLLIGQWLKNT